MNNKKKSWLVLSTLAILGLLICLSPAVNASNAESIAKLRLGKDYVESQGANCRGKASGKYLSQGDHYIVSTTLYRGNKYFIVGAGDSGVDDLDIILLDRYGNEYDRDAAHDAAPIVKANVSTTGTYHIGVKMHQGSGYSNVMVCYE